MSKEEKEKRELATNRLLDLLRAQQVGGEVEEEESKTDEQDVVDETKVSDLTAKEPEPEMVVVEEEGEKTKSEIESVPTSKSLLESLAKAPTTSESAIDAEGEQATETLKETTIGGEFDTVAKGVSEIESPDLLQQIQAKPSTAKIVEEEEIAPAEFDSSLLSSLSEQKDKQTLKDFLVAFFHLFNESWRRVTVHYGKNFLRFLQVKKGFKETIIENFKEYPLPYESENGTISEMGELLTHVLEKEIDPKKKRFAYGACFSPEISTKTHILQTPQLKHNELVDLVEWNAKKNLPFSADQAVINWEATPAVGDPSKQNVVIGIGDEDSIEGAVTWFKKGKLKLRLFSTLPILLWKLFIKNYPDRETGSYILVHIGETQTTIVVVVDQQLLFSREMAVGVEDFYKALMQKVIVGEKSIQIDYPMARQLLNDYGIPRESSGVTVGSKISLYKISIFLRPIVERMTGELNRSLNYFLKQNPGHEWQELLFDGIGATIPHLSEVFGENLNIKVGLLNPIRHGKYVYSNGEVFQDKMLPNFSVNFALASEEAEKINVIPQSLRSNYKYLFLTKVAAMTLVFFLPFFVSTAILSNMKIKRLDKQIETRSKQWDNLSVQAKEYFDIVGDMEILGGYRRFLTNDRIYSINQIKLLKLLSSVVPGDINLTSIKFNKEVVDKEKAEDASQPQKLEDVLEVSGFVQADASISDIHLTNFVMKLEQLAIFRDIKMNIEEHSDPTEGKLFFTLNLRY